MNTLIEVNKFAPLPRLATLALGLTLMLSLLPVQAHEEHGEEKTQETLQACSHSGGTDKCGCHNNKKTGKYHCHKRKQRGNGCPP